MSTPPFELVSAEKEKDTLLSVFSLLKYITLTAANMYIHLLFLLSKLLVILFIILLIIINPQYEFIKMYAYICISPLNVLHIHSVDNLAVRKTPMFKRLSDHLKAFFNSPKPETDLFKSYVCENCYHVFDVPASTLQQKICCPDCKKFFLK